MPDLISRFSSRNQRLSHVFLKDRLKGAETYDRIAGYFRSSVFDLIHEEISTIARVRIVCNADLDPRDLTAAGLSQRARDQAQIGRWHEQGDEIDTLLERPRWRRLHELLTAGNVEIRVVSRDNAPFLHGKAGVITRPDGNTSSFIGSINETANGWAQSYEMVWEDPSPDAAAWVREEFDWLWKKGVPLSQAVIDEIGRTAQKVEVEVEEMRADPVGLAKSVTVESPLVRRGEGLAPWQKAFVKIFVEHDQNYGAARLLLADEVGVGKTLSMAATGALSVLMGHGPFLILCPATLTLQWQMELWDKLGLPSCVWARAPHKGWLDHRGHLYRSRDPEDVLRCPGQIGIVSTGLLVKGGPEAQALMRGNYGMIALDEGHKARVKRGIGYDEPEPGKLYRAMERLAGRTRHLVIGTATPIQTVRDEIWDLIRLLAYQNDHVLGRPSASRWWDPEQALDLISGKTTLTDPETAWPWLRSPLPHAREASVFSDIRYDLQTPEGEFFTDKGVSSLEEDTRDTLAEVLERGEIARRLPFMRYHNPLGRHVVLRRRKTLEEAGLMDRIAVNIHPRPGAAPGVFERSAVRTPHFYDRAYEEVSLFTRAMKARQAGTGFLGNLMMQRICSSVAAGMATATKMLESRREGLVAEETDDPDLLEAIEEMGAGAYAAAVDVEAQHLERVLAILQGAKSEDPKGRAVLHYLDQEGWLALGCIIFSQYYDTARWVGELISATHPTEPVAVYAGVGKSGILLGGEWRSIDREDIKKGVKERKLRVVCATDAACEGLNLQTLGTLINVDLPWNPSRLEQRIGRIKRYGQQRREVDMANLVYAGTIDERVYQRLSERMQDRYDILGSLPDTIEDEWINDIERVEEELKSFTKPESPADVFSLRYGDFERCSPLFGPQEPLDPRLTPGDLLHVVPADASQTRVIEEVRAGRNLVVQGPPGTGKSQTIANIIAGAAHDGKRVLFVAEKMAALSVVHDRLQRVGLAPELAVAFEAITKLQEIVSQIGEEAGLPAPLTLPEATRLHGLLLAAVDRPQGDREAEGTLLPHLETPRLFEALGAGTDWAEARKRADARFQEAAFDLAPDLLRARLAPGVGSFWSRLFGPYRGASRDLGALLSGPLPKGPGDRLALIDELVRLRTLRRTLSDEEVWLQSLLGPQWRGERTPFAELHAQASWLRTLIGISPIGDTEALARICAAASRAPELGQALEGAVGARETITNRLRIAWPEGEEIPFETLSARVERMRAQLDLYGEWARLSTLAFGLIEDGLTPLLTALDEGTLRPEGAVDELLYAIAEARWEAARAVLPELEGVAHLDRHALVAAFRDLEGARMEETQRLVRGKHLAQLPTGASGPMGFLRGEMAKKRRHRSIRQIMKAAGPMVQRIKPVFLMSPISIAQYLPPGTAEFDLLVIDEASQVRPEDALGAIARCRQIVVVGDQKQLPPTSFFDRLAGSEEADEDEEDGIRTAGATEMESVLTLCEARGLNPAMLEWHYRSRDPSLIAVSNAEFYEHRLILPPSPMQNDPEYGLAFRRVAGVYSSRSRGGGRPGTNRIEAEEVAKAVAEHARTRPDLSLGVVAFSKAQADMLTEVLELARRQDEVLDDFLREGRAEDLFVKNIENVQGDERDVILISVGYGPTEPGERLSSMTFGPVNGEGGERRLNVLFSRARTRCVVFCSFDPNDIDLNRVTRDGPRVLKRFLEFARSGKMDQARATGAAADSPFEEDVSDVIRRLGYAREPKVAEAGVDALVRDIHAFAQYYTRMALGKEPDADLAVAFRDLRELKVEVAFPFLLELYHDYDAGQLPKSDFLRAVRLVEAYVFRRAVCAIPTNSLNKTFATFSRVLRKDSYLESIEAHFMTMPSYRRFPDDEEFRRAMAQRDLYNFRSRSYWLRRMENFDRKERVAVDEYTIEHIMPQNENLSSAWCTALGPEWERVQETLLHTVGNLTLTGYNAEYSDRPFAEKRDMHGGFRQSPLRLNEGLGAVEVWNEEAIAKRADHLTGLAVKVWDAPRLPANVLEKYRPQAERTAGYSLSDHPTVAEGGPMEELFHALRREILALDPCMTEEIVKSYIAYKAETNVVDIVTQARQLRLSLNMKFHDLRDPKGIARDMTSIGHYGNGDVEVAIKSNGELPYVVGLIRQSLEQQMAGGEQ